MLSFVQNLGIDPVKLNGVGFSLNNLCVSGVPETELCKVFPLADLVAADCHAESLLEAGFGALALKEHGLSAIGLVNGGYSVSDLVAAWERAQTLDGMAQIAQASAQRTTELRGPLDDPSEGLCAALGALGYARAHTGSARAFIFAPGTAPAIGADILRAAGLSGVFTFDTGGAP